MAEGTKPEFYQVLGIPQTATQEEIKIAFHKLAAEFHAAGKPRNIQDVEEMRSIATAYRVLSDAKKRERYDRFGHANIGDGANVLVGTPSKLDEMLERFESSCEGWVPSTDVFFD